MTDVLFKANAQKIGLYSQSKIVGISDAAQNKLDGMKFRPSRSQKYHIGEKKPHQIQNASDYFASLPWPCVRFGLGSSTVPLLQYPLFSFQTDLLSV
jgi:hypothetical protein